MTKTKIECPSCESNQISLESYERDLCFKGVDIHVKKLERSRCEECGYSFVTHIQHDENIKKIRATFIASRAEFKRKNGLLSGREIRAIRERLGLSQHEAAKIFGGGMNAFSKYENEEIVQNASMDRLVRIVAAHPYLVGELQNIVDPFNYFRNLFGGDGPSVRVIESSPVPLLTNAFAVLPQASVGPVVMTAVIESEEINDETENVPRIVVSALRKQSRSRGKQPDSSPAIVSAGAGNIENQNNIQTFH